MIPFRKSIGFRLLVISVILLAFPLLVDSFIFIQQRYEHTIADTEGYLIETAQSRALPLTQIQPLKKPLFEVMGYFLNLRSHFPDQPSQEIDEKLAKMAHIGEFAAIFLVKITASGEYIVTGSSTPGYEGRNYTDLFHLQDLFSSESSKLGFTSYIAYDKKSGEPYFLLAHVVFSKNENKPLGLLVVAANTTDKLKELLKQDKHRYPVSFALLLPSTVVFAATDPSLNFHYFRPLQPEYRNLYIKEEPTLATRLPDAPIPINEKIGYPFFEFNWQGESQIGYFKKLGEADLILLTYASKKEIYGSGVMNFFDIYSIYALILLLGGIIAYLLTKRMAKPMQNLSSVMQGIQQGEINRRYQKDPWGFEINVLGSIFNTMLDAVLEQKRVAEEERVKREIFASELRLGQQAQRGLLPQKMPYYPSVEVAEIYIPAIEVGGDFYDVFVKKGASASEQLVLAVADASGKGVQACFYSLSIRNMLRTYVKEHEDVGMAMSATNNLFTLDTGETGMFVTIFVGIYEGASRSFHYYSAGHNPGIVRRSNGTIEVLRSHGIAMGFLATGDQFGLSIQLEKGDTVVLYTDGVTEAHNEEFEQFGEERLMQLIEREGGQSAADLAKTIVAAVQAFAGKAPQHDDITLLVMKSL